MNVATSTQQIDLIKAIWEEHLEVAKELPGHAICELLEERLAEA
jgi:hypothetical protein